MDLNVVRSYSSYSYEDNMALKKAVEHGANARKVRAEVSDNAMASKQAIYGKVTIN